MPYASKEENNACKARRRKAVRREVLSHYSKGRLECACCGENEYRFLALDHVNNGGNKERKKYGPSIMYWIKKQGFPPGYQVLCHNCNVAKFWYGKCPHQESEPDKY